MKRLDIVQSQAVRTGAPMSTPIAAMEIQSEVEPLEIRREVAVLKANELLQRLDIH